MRIRKSASRLLGSAYAASAAPLPDVAPPSDLQTPAPPPRPTACSAPESSAWGGLSSSATTSGEPCELSRSPWDLIAELSISDPQEEDDLVDKYFVHVSTRSSWLFSATMPATSSSKKKKKKKKPAAASRDSTQLQHDEVPKKAPKKAGMNKEGEAKKKAKVKKEEGPQDGEAQVWKCKKNDGKRWHCHRTVSQPNTLCAYHFVQKRSYYNPDFELPPSAEPEPEEAAPAPTAASNKPPTTSKPRKKKPSSDFIATEGFYYYAGFGPFRTKRQCRSGGMNEPIPAKEEEEETPENASHHRTDQVAEAAEEDTNQAAHHDVVVSSFDSDFAGIAGVDEESSDDDYDGIGIPGRSMDGNDDPQASSGDGKRKNPWKRWRKPVKARSLKSLM